ncbi:MAG TPA: hypothetical protein VGL39_20880 [Jatrophihabitantaceae bacterium]
MVHPSPDETRHLKAIAREMFESGEESGYLVGVATAHHPAFSRSRRPSSALERELVLDAVRRAASREGVFVEDLSGGVDLVTSDGGHIRRYRVKRGERSTSGYRFVCGLGSSLLTAEPDGLFVEDRWLLGYISSDDHTLDEVVAAEVVGHRGDGGGPVVLILGTVIRLSDAPPPDGFTSTDEGLSGFDDDDEAGGADVA